MEWTPASGLERALLDASQRQDHDGYLRLLNGVGLLAPVRQDESGRTVGWMTSTVGDRTYLLGYTSPESLAAVTGGQDVPWVTASLAELARRWPDPRWWLAINSGLPIEVLIPPEYLAESLASADTGSGGAPVGDLSAEAYARAAAAAVEPRAATTVFRPANEVESAMLAATRQGDIDAYLKALMLAEVLLPRPAGELAGPGDADFTWPTVEFEGQQCVPLFTSGDRLVERYGDVPFARVEALAVIRDWPDLSLTLTLNPGTPVGASLPGPEVRALAEWAAEIGLIDILERSEREEHRGERRDEQLSGQPAEPQILRKLLPPQHVAFYQRRGYHMVSGYVHRLSDVGEGLPLADLRRVLGLDGPDSPFAASDQVAHAVRWPAHGDGRYGDAFPVAGAGSALQFRVSGVPLPHGAVLCRIDANGAETVVARYDADAKQWLDQQ